jgi:uncharacterized protein (DUF885 family)
MRRWILMFCSLVLAACTQASRPLADSPQGDAALEPVLHDYVIGFLQHYPVVNTYLGGAGLDPKLAAADGRLRDDSPTALEAEDRWLGGVLGKLHAIDPDRLSPDRRVDREVAIHQIRYMLHLHQVRHYQQRSLDSYIDEPFRGVDWLLQGMDEQAHGAYGTPADWERLISRLEDIPRFLSVAEHQLAAGAKAGNTPDWRMLERTGLKTSRANAEYFASTLTGIAEQRIPGGPGRGTLLARLQVASRKAAAAYLGLHDFLARTYFEDPSRVGREALKPAFRKDRYMLGEQEYDWALHNNLHVDSTAAELFASAWPRVEATRTEMIRLARRIGTEKGWKLPEDGNAAVRAVFDRLSGDYPKDDDQMIDWYRQTAFRLVDYARRTGLFDVPADYRLEVTRTPPPLQSSIDGAAYYPAPPFKRSGTGRFYVSPTGNDQAKLQANNRAALADLAAHEGFPGHDWNYKVMTMHRDAIPLVRWLTPGAVEDSSSMWEDSMAAEGWALYAESLMAEPQPGAPQGFYTPEEHLYQLQGLLYRDLRVYVDTGLHTGRLSWQKSVDLFSTVTDFLPGSCAEPAALRGDAKRASCESAENAIYRYSQWPTQAITYRLGMDRIRELREKARRRLGSAFSEKVFHMEFMKQGTIPPGYFGDRLLERLQHLAADEGRA